MTCTSERGYAMAALLVALSVMSIMLAAALPSWRTMAQRERETELVFRGEQYVQAIELFSRRTGGFPPSLNVLREGRFIRKLYKDPITDGDFQPVYLGQVGAGGVPAVPGQQPPQPGRGPALFGAPGQQPGSPGPGAPPLTGAPSQLPSPTGRGLAPASPFGQASTPGAGPIIGVTSRSTAQSLRLYNGRNHYNEWLFVSIAATRDAGSGAGTQTPGMSGPGRGGRGGQPPARGRGPGIAPGGLNRGGPIPGLPMPNAPGRTNPANPFGGPNTPAPMSGPGRL